MGGAAAAGAVTVPHSLVIVSDQGLDGPDGEGRKRLSPMGWDMALLVTPPALSLPQALAPSMQRGPGHPCICLFPLRTDRPSAGDFFAPIRVSSCFPSSHARGSRPRDPSRARLLEAAQYRDETRNSKAGTKASPPESP
jgi:hypothetical protein